MKMRIVNFFGILCLLFAFPAYASPYEPLVDIPGMADQVTISSYLIGIYNFFLSIVGIVAVLMIILGGMRYISAAGNSSAIGDAKSMIESAISGLLLALLSWLFVSTINPDILYVRQPGLTKPNSSALLDNPVNIFGENNQSCLAGSSFIGIEGNVTDCKCRDGSSVPHDPADSNCNDLCKSAKKCGDKFLVVKITEDRALDGQVYDLDSNDKLWEFFLTNNGEYDAFDVEAETYLADNSYTCAILATVEIGGLTADHHYIYWVKEGSIISPSSLSIQRSIGDLGTDYVGCCADNATDDCDTDFSLVGGGECDDVSGNKIVRTRFGYNATDECENDCSFAERTSGGEFDYYPARSIRCIGGYWG